MDESKRVAPTYHCLLCGDDHPIVNGRVEHTIFRCPDCGLADNEGSMFDCMACYPRLCSCPPCGSCGGRGAPRKSASGRAAPSSPPSSEGAA